MSMEMTFIATYVAVLLVSIPLGFLIYWIFEKDNEEAEKNGKA